MKASEECYECLYRLANQAAELATRDVQLKAHAVAESLNILKTDFSCDAVSIAVATRMPANIQASTVAGRAGANNASRAISKAVRKRDITRSFIENQKWIELSG